MNHTVPHTLLVARAQLGDLRALDELLRMGQVPLYRHLLHVVGDESVADDLLQETMLVICRKLRTLREPQLYRAWSYRIATRLALRQLRRMKRDPQAVDLGELDGHAEVATANPLEHDELSKLHDLLEKAPAASQLILRMHYLDELTHAEIAEVLDISVGTVKSRLNYGLTWMRRQLGASQG